MDQPKVPEHLKELDNLRCNIYPSEIDAEKYANTAFDLMKVSEGDKEALKRVTEFIQSMYRDNKSNVRSLTNLKDKIGSYVYWGTHWTVRSEVNQVDLLKKQEEKK